MAKIMALYQFLIMFSVLLLTCFVPVQGEEITLESTKSRAVGALEKIRDLGKLNQSECKLSGKTIHFIGPTGKALASCLNKYPQSKNLEITSWGGEVLASLTAAKLIEERGVGLHVLGICFSSCGNYIVPAARKLTVLPFSSIGLHGAPPDDEAAIRLELIAALKKAGLPEDQITEELLSNQMQNILDVRQQHEAFQQRHSIGASWYDFEFLKSISPVNDLRLIVSASFVKSCLPSAKIRRYWQPTNATTIKEMRRLLTGQLVFLGHDVKVPPKC